MAVIDDIAICGHAYYAGESAAGLRACERLLSSDAGSAVDEEWVRRNRTWYTPRMDDLFGGVILRELHVAPAMPGWSVFNPSFCADGADGDGGLIGVVRSSNYTVTAAGHYVSPPEDGDRIRTRNILVRIDRDGSVTHRCDLLGPGYDTSDFPIEGMEDLRLWRGGKWEGRPWKVSGTVCDLAGTAGQRRIGVATLMPDCGILCDFSSPEPPIAGRHEKNWQPIGGGSFVYANWEDGSLATVGWSVAGWALQRDVRPSPWIARGWRGGSQLVPWPGGGYASCIHEVAVIGGRRTYEHRVVRYDDSLQIVAWTLPFYFRRPRGIEFCAGAAIVGHDLFLTFGDNDKSAWMARCEVGSVERAWKTGWRAGC